ncbi:cupin domain-containing protein [Patescibacteria group bacterium]
MKHINISDLPDIPTSHNKNMLKKVIAKRGDIPHMPQIGRVTIKSGDVAENHSHPDMYEVFYIEKGQGNLKLDGKDKTFKAGEVLIIEPGEEHEFSNNSKEDVVMYYFEIEE